MNAITTIPTDTLIYFLQIALGGLAGSAITAGFSYVVQNKLAKARRTEQEKRYAYFCFIAVCKQKAALEFLGPLLEDKIKPVLSELESKVLPSIKKLLMGKDHSMSEWLCAIFAVVGKEKIESISSSIKHMDLDFLYNAQQIKTSLESPDQIINLPKAVISAYNDYAVRATDFAIKTRNLTKAISEADSSIVTTKLIFDFVEAFRLHAKENTKLYEAFISSRCVSKADADQLHSRFFEHLEELMMAAQGRKERLQSATESATLTWELIKAGGKLSDDRMAHYLKIAASRGNKEAQEELAKLTEGLKGN